MPRYTKESWTDGSGNAIDASSLNHMETQFDSAMSMCLWYPAAPITARVSTNWQSAVGYRGASVGATHALGNVTAVPFVLSEDLTVDSFSVQFTAAVATSLLRGAIFDTGASGFMPGTTLQDFGTMSGAAAGFIGSTPTTPLLLRGYTLYWMAFEASVAAPTVMTADNSYLPRFPFDTSLSENVVLGGRTIQTWNGRTAGPFSGAWGGAQGGAGNHFAFGLRKA